MRPRERLEALENERRAGRLLLIVDDIDWLLAVAGAAVAWRNSHGEGTMTDACIEARLIAVVDGTDAEVGK